MFGWMDVQVNGWVRGWVRDRVGCFGRLGEGYVRWRLFTSESNEGLLNDLSMNIFSVNNRETFVDK